MLVISIIPVENEPVLFMATETEGNAIKDLDLNLSEKDIAVSFLELESGEATLLQDNNGKSILINTGGKQSIEKFKQQMKIFNVNQLDAVFLTNMESQYTGNLEWLLKEYKVKEIYVSETMKDHIQGMFDLKGVKVNALSVGLSMKALNKIDLTVPYIESRNGYDLGGLTLSLKYGEHRFLFMGVSNAQADQSLIKSGRLNISLLKVGGFGHYFGTSEELIQHINPQVAVIFKKSEYTPSEEVLNRLDNHWVEILKPYDQGIVMVKWNDQSYEITQVPLTEPEMASALK